MQWSNQKRKITELKATDYNPRRWTEETSARLSKSIEKYDLCDPIIINADNTIIGGHFRLKILKEKGVSEVDVRVPDRQLTLDEEKELNLRLNKNLGDWDYDLLNDFPEDMLKDVGFEQGELGYKIDGYGEEFTLPDGDKAPFQQMTFTLADEQAKLIKQKIDDAKKSDLYKYCETYGNENSNGNALYCLLRDLNG
jgi:nitrogen fixation protein